MAATRAQLRLIIQQNLTGNPVTSAFYADEEINESLQDAENEIAGKTRFLVKKVTYNWASRKNYYDPVVDLGITDFLGVIAIFDHNSNLWLRDDVSIRDFNRIRRDWELWSGESQFWAPHSQKRFAVCPALFVGTGTFDLWYYATPAAFVDDTSVSLVSADMDILLTDYTTADMLESAEEVNKAQAYLGRYNDKLMRYQERTHNLAASQLLLRI